MPNSPIPPDISKGEKTIHKIFEWGVIIKGVDGILETAGGIFWFLLSPDKINRTVAALTQHELSQEPKDFLATHLLAVVGHLSASTKLFQALYLFVHGIIKIFLVWGLLKNKLWAYPASLAFLIIFIVYQLYRFSVTGALSLIVLTVFDVLIVWLTLHEYNYYKKYKHFPD